MSMPSTDLVCNKCDFRGSNAVVWGDFRYVVDGREIPLERRLGWCTDCSNFVPMEDFSIKDELLVQSEGILESMRIRTKRWASFLMLGSTRQDRLNELERLSGLIDQLALIGKRNGSERCLKCGSANVERFSGIYAGLHPYSSDQEAIQTGFLHPGCGGEFLASTCPIRFHLRFDPKFYSVDGYRLDY